MRGRRLSIFFFELSNRQRQNTLEMQVPFEREIDIWQQFSNSFYTQSIGDFDVLESSRKTNLMSCGTIQIRVNPMRCTFKVWWMWPLAFSMTFWVGFLLRIKVEHEFRCLTKKTKRSTKRTMAMADKVTAIPAISPLSNEATPPTKYPTCKKRWVIRVA